MARKIRKSLNALNSGLDRRQFVAGASAIGAAAAGAFPSITPAFAAPNKGGHLRIGTAEGSTSDNLDPAPDSSAFITMLSSTYLSQLTEVDANGSLDPNLGTPDRNRVVDVDGDGNLDAVVGFSHFPGPDTDLLWLEAPDDPTGTWTPRRSWHMASTGPTYSEGTWIVARIIGSSMRRYSELSGSAAVRNDEAGGVWLQRLLATFGKAVWLNPVPQDHWDYTWSIQAIRRIFEDRMFPLTLDGLEEAMRALAR